MPPRSTRAGTIVLPGFVDTHRHTWQTPVRGVLPSCTLDEYFAGMLDNIGIHYRAEDVYIANLMGALEALNAGITTLLDWSHVNNTPEHADAAIEGLASAGIRAIYAHGVPVGGSQWWAYSSRPHPEDIRRIRTQYFSVRRSAVDARPGGARAGQCDSRKSPRTTGRSPATWGSASASTSGCV